MVLFCTLFLLALSPVLVPLYIVYEVASTIFLEVRTIFQAKPKIENEENHSTFEESFENSDEEKEQNPDDPHIILGVTRGASKEEIVKAYRQLIVKNHPDKVASLDPELQRSANNRTVIIQRAYEELFEGY